MNTFRTRRPLLVEATRCVAPMTITTDTGVRQVKAGDWIIDGEDHERYVVDDAFFSADIRSRRMGARERGPGIRQLGLVIFRVGNSRDIDMSSFAVMVLPTLIAGLILAVFYGVSAHRDRMHRQESRRIHAILKGEVRIGRSRPSVGSGGRMRQMEGKLRASA